MEWDKTGIEMATRLNFEAHCRTLDALKRVYHEQVAKEEERYKKRREEIIKLCEEHGGHKDKGLMFYAECKHCGVHEEE